MTERLTPKGYLLTKEKLASMLYRLGALRARTSGDPHQKEMAIHSYLDMIRQFRKEIKLYKASQAKLDRLKTA